MKNTLLIAAIVLFVCYLTPQPPDILRHDSCSTAEPDTRSANQTASSETATVTETNPTTDSENNPPTTIKPLTAEQQEQLLSARLHGGMGGSFGQFANMFMVSSRIYLGTSVGLVASSHEIAEAPLQSPFPASYKPTFREFLDAIALQTFSEWKYSSDSKHLESEVRLETPLEDLAFFEFTKRSREKPFEVTLADGWKA